MKFLMAPFVLLMLPIAFLFVAFDVAKAFVEAKLKEKNHD